jgi:type II secretory pathway pseudopilin PulG
MKRNKGFALIEMIIYVGLFGILIGGLLVSVFHISTSTYETDEDIVVHEEMNFVVKKLDWALSDASDISVPNASTLVVTNPNIPGNTLTFHYDVSDPDYKTITLKVGGGSEDPITTTDVSVENTVSDPTKFELIAGSPSVPEGVRIFLNIDGAVIEFEKYLKYVP